MYAYARTATYLNRNPWDISPHIGIATSVYRHVYHTQHTCPPIAIYIPTTNIYITTYIHIATYTYRLRFFHCLSIDILYRQYRHISTHRAIAIVT